MNWRAVGAVIRKDLMAVFRSKSVVIPLILVPVFLLVLMPGGFGVAANLVPVTDLSQIEDFKNLMKAMPPGLQDQLAAYEPNQLLLVLTLLYLFAPLYLVIPMMVASVIAADSFAGEKERKTLEALLHTPITDRELILGKLLSAWLPAIGVALGSFVLYGVVANAVGWPVMGRLFFPNTTWIVLALWVGPAASGLGLSMTVLVSIRAKTFQEAYQLGGVVVLPVVALMLAQLGGVIYLSAGLTLLLGLGLWLVDAGLLWVGMRIFRRSELISRL